MCVATFPSRFPPLQSDRCGSLRNSVQAPPLPARVRLRAYCRPEPGRSQNSSPASLTRPTPHPANAFNHSKRSLLHSSTYPSQLYLHMQIQLGCNSRGLIDTVLTRCSCTYGYNPLQMRSCPREGLRSVFCIQFAFVAYSVQPRVQFST